ncbi:DUF1345 domain-containing protein [Paenarthrobacter nitroguajacolicus]|uniref:DUF1345 domain-containing protein n=1 Tax=Paenarthrobacter nitroguajacolicus TaxID=211146 RepID=UPI00248A9AF7|nr:DUF1345 domain-containing protein [Paenarthrobacter nitroguajacolicus]MDI2033208.1 hypothetical protein [Paenarthrobacter nitroguajacolicus]
MNGRILSARRALVCVGFGVLAGTAAGLALAPALAPLVAWCTAGIIALAWAWRICWQQDPPGTERIAREESTSRLTDNAIITACLASIAAVGVALIQSGNRDDDPVSVALVVVGVLGTIVAWALVNTVYALKYARMYYVDRDGGGFDDKDGRQPAYSDFAYFAFTVGMTYAPPEVETGSTEIRRKALLHALLSYFFGTVLIAVSLNAITNLSQG